MWLLCQGRLLFKKWWTEDVIADSRAIRSRGRCSILKVFRSCSSKSNPPVLTPVFSVRFREQRNKSKTTRSRAIKRPITDPASCGALNNGKTGRNNYADVGRLLSKSTRRREDAVFEWISLNETSEKTLTEVKPTIVMPTSFLHFTLCCQLM